MDVVTGEKSYLLTDYCPRRKYALAKFTDGNGKQWWQLAYRWGWWTFYLNRLTRFASGCTGVRHPMMFDTPDKAKEHLAWERDEIDREAKSQDISVEFVGE
jgi:hypothetical protein